MLSSSMLCAFFNTRMKGLDTKKKLKTLFGPFWEEASVFSHADHDLEQYRKWMVDEKWIQASKSDGSARALGLLDFRVNFLSRLLEVSDCWSRAIGRHLAHWLDAHVHLIIDVEARESGPSSTALVDARTLRMCDWRHEFPAHILGVREVFFEHGSTVSPLGGLYGKLIANMALCKTLDKSVSNVGRTATGRETICASLVRCLLGVGSHKANLSLRRSVHLALKVGVDSFFAQVQTLSAQHMFPVVFVALREFVISAAHNDMALNGHLRRIAKWDAFAANTFNTAELLRVKLRTRLVDGDLFLYKLASTVSEQVALMRHCKKVPGLFSRSGCKDVSLQNACKMLKRIRDRRVGNNALNTDTFSSVSGAALSGMVHMGSLPMTACVPFDVVMNVLKTAGPPASRIFIDLVDAMKLGTEHVMRIGNAHSDTCGLASNAFVHACDCLELINLCDTFFKIELPDAIGDLQRAAVLRRFPQLSPSDGWSRASRIIWCGGCKTIKNFIVSKASKDVHNHTAYGYKKVSQGPHGLMCYERRRFACCRVVPVRQTVILSRDSSQCASLFGSVYTMTTCCGHLALLQDLTAQTNGLLCCQKCIEASAIKARVSVTLVCHYCNEKVKTNRGFFSGVFEDSDQTHKTLTFCNRHVREFMKRSDEPINLTECMRLLGRRFRSAKGST